MLTLRTFQERVVVTEDGHWLWTGAYSGNGRGYCQVDGKTVVATRVAWELRYGESPGDLHLHHTCSVKICVNPDHLTLVTRSEHGKLHHPRGSTCPSGHERNAKDTYVTSKGKWVCRACDRERKRREYHAARLVP